MYRDILAYTSAACASITSEYAAAFTAALKARLTLLTIEVDYLPGLPDYDQEALYDLLLEERTKARDQCLEISRLYETAATRYHVPCDVLRRTSVAADLPKIVAATARTFDCVILSPYDQYPGSAIDIIEQVLFGSGRPVLLLPNAPIACSLGHIAIAWDGSRAAARAVNDALPLLSEATAVDVLVIGGEKPLDGVPSGEDLVRHLKAHTIPAVFEELRFSAATIGEQIMAEALDRRAGLLIMGAYGHSRIKEIVFGGATRDVIHDPRLPILMAQ